MKVLVNQSNIAGEATVPSSKSMTIRGLMCAALAKGESEIVNPLVSEDTEAAADVLTKIGVDIRKESGSWRVAGGNLRASDGELYCGESATTLRFMTAICALIPGEHRLTGGPSLSKRPVRSLTDALRKLGVKVSIEGKTSPPVIINGGSLRGGLTELPGHISSQFISALMLVAPFAEKEVNIKLTTPMTSRPYVRMTMRSQREFGVNIKTDFDKFVIKRQRYKPARFEVEGDWSSASYLVALGAFSEQGLTVRNVRSSSVQGDKVILDFLRNMGVQVRIAADSITVNKGSLKAINADLSDCIDLLPTMAVLDALADGTGNLTGIERARIKESNRVASVKEGLTKMEIPVVEVDNRLKITGLLTPDPNKKAEEEEEDEEDGEKKETEEAVVKEPVVIDSHNDHRIAMAFAVFGVANGNVIIDGAECVAKTYPDFWETLQSVGGELKIDRE